jgi:sigma-E factor negative regulatory protein RseC
MISAEGRIDLVRDGRARIRILPASGCGSCRSRSACGAGSERLVWVAAPAGAGIGDRVSLQVPAGSLNRAALLAYLLPAVTTLVAATIAAPAGDLAAALAAATGLAFGLVLLRILGRRLAQQEAPITCVPISPIATGGFS